MSNPSELADLVARRDALQAQIDLAMAEAKAVGLAAVRVAMAEHGLTVADLAGTPSKAKPSVPVPVKYRDEHGHTWTGRGIKPVWMQGALAAGRSLDSFLIAAPGA